MPLTPRMKWSIPSEDADPWYDALTALFNQQEAAAYAGREDRNIILMGGGTISWTLSTGILAWDEPIRVLSPVSGFQCVVAAGSVQLDQSGKLAHAPLVRYPQGGNKTITVASASQVPDVSPNDQLLFAVRYGDVIYWRNGVVLGDGESVSNFKGSGFTAGGDLAGSATSQTVEGIQGRAIAATAPTTGQVYKWSGSQWEPSADAGGTMPTMVFKPGGVASGNVYSSWANLMAAFATIQGPVWIELDDTDLVVTIPTGTHDMEGRAHFVSKNSTTHSVVRLDPGCVLYRPASFRRLYVDSLAASTGNIRFTAGSSWYAFDCYFTTNSSASPLIDQYAGTTVWLRDTTVTSIGASYPVIACGGANGGSHTIFAEGFSSITDNVFSGNYPLTVWLENTWTTCGATHPARTSGVTINAPSAGFAAGGDLSGTASDQTVSYLQDMPVPPAEEAAVNNVLVTGNAVGSPRPIVADGSDMWVGDHKQSTVIDGVVARYELVSGTPPTAKIAATVDLTAVDSNVDGVRDLAVDSTYVYATGWNAGTIAIISRATNAIVGWGTIYVTAVGSSRAISVTADDAGKFYVVGFDEAGSDTLFRFDTTACIGATPGGGGKQGPEATQALVARRREIRYGGGFLWLTNGGNDADALWKHDPSTLGSLGSFTGDGHGMSVLYAYASVWVTDQGGAGVVYRVNPTTLGQTAAVSVTGSQPNGIGLGPNDTGAADAKIFVTDNGDRGVSVIDPGTSLEDTTVAVTQDDNDGVASFENAAFVTSRDIGAGTEGVSLILGDSSSFTVSDVSLLELFYGLPVLPSNSLVFQPGGTPGGNVYDDWSLLMAAFAETSGIVTILIDGSSGSPSVLAGTWDLEGRAILIGTRNSTIKTSLDFSTLGVAVQNPAGFERLTLVTSGPFNGVVQIPGGEVYFQDCSIACAGNNPLFQLSGAGTILRFINTTTADSGTDAITVASDTTYIYMQGFSDIADDVLAGAGNFVVTLQSVGAQTCSTTQTNHTGSLTVTPYGFAAGSDLSGTAISQTVIKLQGRDVASTAPNDGEVLTWSTGNTRWEPAASSGGGATVKALTKGTFANATVTPAAVGAAYLDTNEVPTTTIKLRVVLETTSGSAGYEAYFDLYDVNGVVSGGTPAVVTGSQLDTGSSSPPSGGPTPNPLVPSAYEVDITSAFSGWTNPGTFEARLWIGTAGGGNAATCKSAELIFE